MEHDGAWRQLAVLDCRVLRSSVRTGRCSAWRGWPVQKVPAGDGGTREREEKRVFTMA